MVFPAKLASQSNTSRPNKIEPRARLSSNNVVKEKCYRKSNLSSSMYFSDLSSPKNKRLLSPNSRSIPTQPLSQASKLQSAHHTTPKTISDLRKMADQSRPSRCLPSRRDPPLLQKIPCLQMGRKHLLVQGNAFRPIHRPGSIHWLDGLPSKAFPTNRNLLHCLPRRLDLRSKLSGGMQRYRQTSYEKVQRSRIPRKRTEIQSNPHHVSDMARSRVGLVWRKITPPIRKISKNPGKGEKSPAKQKGIEKRPGVINRRHVLHRSLGTSSSNQEKTLSIDPEKLAKGPSRPLGPSSEQIPRTTSLVDISRQFSRMDSFPPTVKNPTDVDRCLTSRLGCSPGGRVMASRELESASTLDSHRRVGADGHPSGHRKQSGSKLCLPKPPHRQLGGILDSEIQRFKVFKEINTANRTNSQRVSEEEHTLDPNQNPRLPKCSSRRSLQRHSSPCRMESGSKRPASYFQSLGNSSNRSYGDTLQCSNEPLCLPLPSPKGPGSQCHDGGLEQVGENLSVSPPKDANPNPGSPERLQGHSNLNLSGLHNASIIPNSSLTSPEHSSPDTSSFSTCQGELGQGYRSLVLSMDRLSFLRSQLLKSRSEDVVNRLLKSTRLSTQKQQEIAWKNLQNWLRENDKDISENTILQFLCHLHDNKNLATSTILNYKAALFLPLSFIPGIDLNSWSFQELSKALFLEKPPKQRYIPKWDISKVLNMLKDKRVYIHEPDSYSVLKKCLFLVALASGNRVSELSSIERTGIKFDPRNKSVMLPVKPGFLYKNQRRGRAPPNISFPALRKGSPLCPVESLRSYLKLSNAPSGPLFLNSKSGKALHPSTLSRILVEVIEEADPGKIAKAHDVRRMAASLAWGRGVPPAEIIKNLFWSSSSSFIKCYLIPTKN